MVVVDGKIYHVKIDGNVVYVATNGGIVHYSFRTGKKIKETRVSRTHRPISVFDVHNGNIATTTFEDGCVHYFEKDRSIPDHWRRHIGVVECVAIKNNWIACGTLDNKVHVQKRVDGPDGYPTWTLGEHETFVVAVDIEGDTVVSASKDGVIKVWKLDQTLSTWNHVQYLYANVNTISCLKIVSGMNMIVCGSKDIRIWDSNSFEFKLLIDKYSKANVTSVALGMIKRMKIGYIVSGHDNGRYIVWNPKTGNLLLKLNTRETLLLGRFKVYIDVKDGKIVSALGYGTLNIFDFEKLVLEVYEKMFTVIDFMKDSPLEQEQAIIGKYLTSDFKGISYELVREIYKVAKKRHRAFSRKVLVAGDGDGDA